MAKIPQVFLSKYYLLPIMDGIGQVWGAVRNPLPQEPHLDRMISAVGAGYSKYNQFDEKVADTTVQWLNTVDQTQPWMLFSSFVAPHFPLVVPQQYLDLYDPDSVLWPALRLE